MSDRSPSLNSPSLQHDIPQESDSYATARDAMQSLEDTARLVANIGQTGYNYMHAIKNSIEPNTPTSVPHELPSAGMPIGPPKFEVTTRPAGPPRSLGLWQEETTKDIPWPRFGWTLVTRDCDAVAREDDAEQNRRGSEATPARYDRLKLGGRVSWEVRRSAWSGVGEEEDIIGLPPLPTRLLSQVERPRDATADTRRPFKKHRKRNRRNPPRPESSG